MFHQEKPSTTSATSAQSPESPESPGSEQLVLPLYYCDDPRAYCPLCGSYIGDAYCKKSGCGRDMSESLLGHAEALSRLFAFRNMLQEAYLSNVEAGPSDSSSNPQVGCEAGQSDSLTIHQVGSQSQIPGKCLMCPRICTGEPDGFPSTEYCSKSCHDLYRNPDSKPVSISIQYELPEGARLDDYCKCCHSTYSKDTHGCPNKRCDGSHVGRDGSFNPDYTESSEAIEWARIQNMLDFPPPEHCSVCNSFGTLWCGLCPGCAN